MHNSQRFALSQVTWCVDKLSCARMHPAVCMCCHARNNNKFSNVISLVHRYSKYTKALTFEKFYPVHMTLRCSRQVCAAGAVYVYVYVCGCGKLSSRIGEFFSYYFDSAKNKKQKNHLKTMFKSVLEILSSNVESHTYWLQYITSQRFSHFNY